VLGVRVAVRDALQPYRLAPAWDLRPSEGCHRRSTAASRRPTRARRRWLGARRCDAPRAVAFPARFTLLELSHLIPDLPVAAPRCPADQRHRRTPAPLARGAIHHLTHTARPARPSGGIERSGRPQSTNAPLGEPTADVAVVLVAGHRLGARAAANDRRPLHPDLAVRRPHLSLQDRGRGAPVSCRVRTRATTRRELRSGLSRNDVEDGVR
jgi:hypothetical protein